MAATLQLVAGLRNAAASVFYVANLLAASGADMPYLEHTWSLSLEEQFYLLWPVLLLVLLRRGTRLRWIVTGLVVAASASHSSASPCGPTRPAPPACTTARTPAPTPS